MRYPILALVLFLSVPAWAGRYTDYFREGGVRTDAAFSAAQRGYVSDMMRLLKGSDFHFVFRTDARHWIGVGTENGRPAIYIHDETALYNCRALVNLKTGALTVLRGVDYDGLRKQQDADRTAEAAVEYFRKVMSGGSVFGGASPVKPQVHAAKKTSAKKETTAAKESPHKAAEDAVHTKESVKAGETAPHDAVEAANPVAKLREGNLRFVKGSLLHPNQGAGRVKETAKGQHPFAIIVSCSDSRVPPEILFDQGVGDLFVVRTAGEVVQAVDIGSVEYAAEHLHAPLIVVMGHKRCGAVDATIKGGHVPDNILAIAKIIAPAVEKAKGMKGDLLDNAVRINAENMAQAIERSPVIEELLKEQKIRIVTAYYDIDDGTVSFGD